MILILLSALISPQTEEEQSFYTLETFTPPTGEVIEVGGMDFDSQGVLYVSTRRGRVWRIENALAETPSDAQWSIFAEGLHSGLGLKVVEDQVYVLQRGELSRLEDRDGDGVAEAIHTLSQGWGLTGNYHEFAFGLPRDDDGNYYISTNVGFWSPEWWHGLSKAPWRGWVLKVKPDGEVEPIASGVRSPCGLGWNQEGDLFYTDNQGDWMPVCGLFHVTPGAFFGHPASLRWTEAYGMGKDIPSSIEPPAQKRKPAAVWLPYEWSRSTGSLVTDSTGGRFGPFSGQQFVAELTNGNLLRVSMEKVRGEYQGAVFPFMADLGSAVRVRFAPDGSLFVGYTNRGWGGRAPGDGLARVRWSGENPTEMTSVHLEQDGFLVRFTEPHRAQVELSELSVREYDYNYWWDYGSPEMRERMLSVSSAKWSADGMSLKLTIPDLKAGNCVRVQLPGLGLIHDEFAYTINQLPEGPLATEQVSKRVAPPSEKVNDNEGWLHLTWGDALTLWEGDGWELCEVRADPENLWQFKHGPGNSAIANVGDPRGDLRSTIELGSFDFRFMVQLPQGSDSGLYVHDRYELQLKDSASESGGVHSVKNPRAKGWRGPHEWHVVTGSFIAPRFDAAGNRVAKAQFQNIAMDGVQVLLSAECDGQSGGGLDGEVALGPLRFQGTMGQVAIADVRVRPHHIPTDFEGWASLEDSQQVEGDFSIQARVRIRDGVAGLRVGEQTVVINSIGPTSARTGSVLPGHSLGVDLIEPKTWMHFGVERRGELLQVSLNGVLIQAVPYAGEETVTVSWDHGGPESGFEIEYAYWR